MTEKPLRAKPPKIARKYRVPWADLLQKVFAIDVLACPNCNGRMQLIAFIAQVTVAKRILDHLGLDSTGPPVARAAPPPEQVDLGPSYGRGPHLPRVSRRALAAVDGRVLGLPRNVPNALVGLVWSSYPRAATSSQTVPVRATPEPGRTMAHTRAAWLDRPDPASGGAP
jgi:hypothetical protein